MKTKYGIYIALFVGLLFTSCKSTLDPDMYGSLTVDEYFSDVNSINSAVNAAYQSLQDDGGYMRAMWTIGDIASDDTYSGDDKLDGLDGDPNNGTLTSMWRAHYKGIYRCNVVINRIKGVSFPANRVGLKPQFEGQAYFLRALYYYNLVRVFGDVPLITEEITTSAESYVGRTAKSKIYEQIIADAKSASELLPEVYAASIPNTGMSQEKGRATKGAAYMLLSSVYLTLGDFAKAKEYSTAILNLTNKYSLLSSYADLFCKPSVGSGNTYPQENTDESIFEVQFGDQSGRGTNATWWMGPQSWDTGLRYNRPTDKTNKDAGVFVAYTDKSTLVQDFEAGDFRATACLFSTTNSGDVNASTGLPWKFCGKYLVKGKVNNNDPANFPVFRYAETLLILAETENELNGPTNAYQYINQVRKRAGLSDLAPGLSKDQFRNAVYHERRIELCFEAKRWFDLVRTGRMKSIMSDHLGKTIGDHQNIFPIPKLERDVNPLLTQNPGY